MVSFGSCANGILFHAWPLFCFIALFLLFPFSGFYSCLCIMDWELSHGMGRSILHLEDGDGIDCIIIAEVDSSASSESGRGR